jgi:hypothetical protein
VDDDPIDEEASADDEAADDEALAAEAERHLARLGVALAVVDDDSLRRALLTMREKSRLELAEQLNLPRAAMHLGDALVALFRKKVRAAPPARQLAIAFALTEDTNDDVVSALGDRHEDPTRDDMLEVLPDAIDRNGLALVRLLLAGYAASNATCQAVTADLMDTDERFTLPEEPPPLPDEAVAAPLLRVATPEDEARQAAKREQRRETKAAKRAVEGQRKHAQVAAEAARREAQHRAKRRRPTR